MVAKMMDKLTRKVTLTGIADLMCDRYAGDNKTDLEVEDKFYKAPDGQTLVIPSNNIVSLLTAQNTPSAPKRFLDPRKYKAVAQAIQSFTAITPRLIPIMKNGEKIRFVGPFVNDYDEATGCYVVRNVARLDKGIPNPKVRPVVPVPWELHFELTYFKNADVSEEQVRSLLERAGLAIGIGTFRGVFGKFLLSQWE